MIDRCITRDREREEEKGIERERREKYTHKNTTMQVQILCSTRHLFL